MIFLQKIRNYRKKGDRFWLVMSLLILLLISIPLWILLYPLIFQSSGSFEVISKTLRNDEITTTLILVISTALLSALIGIPAAWFISRYDFPLRKFFSWALLLPLTIPGYIMAFTYAGFFNYAGPLQTFTRNNISPEAAHTIYFDFLTFPFLVIVLSLSLFPYLFITAKTAFTFRTNTYLEAAQSLGDSPAKRFFRIALPLARPAIAGGALLVMMEVLNDYGAASYFGIRTFTVSIFRTWALDLNSALILASLLLIVVFIILLLERWLRGRAKYTESIKSLPPSRIKLTKGKALIAFSSCAIPFFFGFLLPLLLIIYWTYRTYDDVMDTRFFDLAWNSLVLAFIATIVVIIAAFIISYQQHLRKSEGGLISRFATIGYAVPGAVIAVGVLVFSGWADTWMNENLFPGSGLIFTGSILIMVFGYLVRFIAVAFQPLDTAMKKQASKLNEASRSLGKNSFQTLFRIDIPLLKKSVLVAAILVFVDVLKELPLTMILRPFDFNTLSTEAFRYAKVMESVPESANAAIIIIFIGFIPVLLLNRLMKTRENVF
jgi:iron(III) transport system permease protein